MQFLLTLEDYVFVGDIEIIIFNSFSSVFNILEESQSANTKKGAIVEFFFHFSIVEQPRLTFINV